MKTQQSERSTKYNSSEEKNTVTQNYTQHESDPKD